MKFSVEHHKTYVIEYTEEEYFKLLKTLRIWNRNFMGELKCVNLFKASEKSFPTGYLGIVLKKLEKRGVRPDIEDRRKYPQPKYIFEKKSAPRQLYDTQKIALESIEKNQTGIISSATGSGKSVIILETFLQKRVKTLIIVPTITIQKQLYKDFTDAIGSKNVSMKIPKTILEHKKTGSSYSDFEQKTEKKQKLGSIYTQDQSFDKKTSKKIGSSYVEGIKKETIPENDFLNRKKNHENHQKWKKKTLEKKHNIFQKRTSYPVTILCYQSLDSLPQIFFDEIECVIIDECHHASSGSIRDALLRMPKAAYRYGFSATAWRDKHDEELLLYSALSDNIIYDLSANDAIGLNLIAKPRLETINAPTPDIYVQNIRHWRSVLEQGIIANKTRNKVIINKAKELIESGRNVLICVDEISHLEILNQRFLKEKIEPIIIHGQMDSKLKDLNIKRVSEEKSGIVSIATMAVGEGANLVNVDVVILASGGKGSIRLLQRIGRGTRKTETKAEVLVIDFFDWFNPLLSKHSRIRKKIFQETFEKK